MNNQPAQQRRLKRELGRRDLVALFVVAIVNLNVVPSIASNGGVTIWLWLLALIFFFWPQGIAVVELAHRYPGEGGVYLWTKQVFGGFHGFLSGWCYWTNNIFYVPTVLLYFAGISVFLAGANHRALGEDTSYVLGTSLLLLIVLTGLNVVGLGVGKWVNNLGGIGTVLAAIIIIGLALAAGSQGGLTLNDLRLPGDVRLLSSFGIICFGLVGLELASVMGDEIQEPLRSLPWAVLWGGIISGVLYLGVTLSLLVSVPRGEIGVVQGVMDAVTRISGMLKANWIAPVFAMGLCISIAGIASAWFAGSARIPFVAGIDSYLPTILARVHPRYATPYIALICQAALSGVFLAISFIGSGVKEAFTTLLDLAVVLQLVPFLYLYAALIRLSERTQKHARFGRRRLRAAGVSGLVTTALAMIVAFIPSHQINSIVAFELKMILGTLFFIGLAAFFFYSRAMKSPASGGAARL